MTIDRDHDIYLIAESTNLEVLEDMIQWLDYLDTVNGAHTTTDGKHVLVLWHTEDERWHIRSWASHRYPVSLLRDSVRRDGQIRAHPVSP